MALCSAILVSCSLVNDDDSNISPVPNVRRQGTKLESSPRAGANSHTVEIDNVEVCGSSQCFQPLARAPVANFISSSSNKVLSDRPSPNTAQDTERCNDQSTALLLLHQPVCSPQCS